MKFVSKIIKFIAIALLVIGLIPIWSPIAVLGGALYIVFRVSKIFLGENEQKTKEYKSKHHIPSEEKNWNSYEDYLNSETWKSKRSAVLERANNECEVSGCSREANEVHHERYPQDLGYEELGDLKAVCRECHSKMHPDKPDR